MISFNSMGYLTGEHLLCLIHWALPAERFSESWKSCDSKAPGH